MASIVDVCNLALSRLGHGKRITALTDATQEARLCSALYEQARDEVLSDFPWPGLRKAVALAEITDPLIPGWSYAYEVPVDCLTVLALMPETGVRYPMRWGDIWNDRLELRQRYPFEIQLKASEDARQIVTDLPDAYLLYVAQINDPNVWGPLLRSAIAWKIASEVGLPLQAKLDMVQNAMNQYEVARGRAAAAAFNEEQPDPEQDSPAILARQ